MPDSMLSPSPIGDRFRIEHRVAGGGMGTIYRAHDGKTGQPVAIKVLELTPAAQRPHKRSFREIESLSTLTHPGIVRYIAHGETTDGSRYLAMEWLDGETLAARLVRQPLTIDEALIVLRQVAEALAVVHERGIVHCDIKPSDGARCRSRRRRGYANGLRTSCG